VGNWFTVVGGALVAVLPQVFTSIIPLIPPPWGSILSAVMVAGLAKWHLEQPPPNTTVTHNITGEVTHGPVTK
jgi:hypothetical protein